MSPRAWLFAIPLSLLAWAGIIGLAYFGAWAGQWAIKVIGMTPF